jgi:hypothetical protein
MYLYNPEMLNIVTKTYEFWINESNNHLIKYMFLKWVNVKVCLSLCIQCRQMGRVEVERQLFLSQH